MKVRFRPAAYDAAAVRQLAKLLLPLDNESPARCDWYSRHAGQISEAADQANDSTTSAPNTAGDTP